MVRQVAVLERSTSRGSWVTRLLAWWIARVSTLRPPADFR